MNFDPRLPSSGLVVLVGGSGAGKTTALMKIIQGGANCFEKPLSRCLVLAAHPEQSAYTQLTRFVPSVSFYQIDHQRGITTSDLKREFNISSSETAKGTRLLIIDDVKSYTFVVEHWDINLYYFSAGT